MTTEKKPYLLNLNTDLVETVDKLRGDIPRSSYVEDAIKAYNDRMTKKQRYYDEHKTEIDEEVRYLEEHPEEAEKMMRELK